LQRNRADHGRIFGGSIGGGPVFGTIQKDFGQIPAVETRNGRVVVKPATFKREAFSEAPIAEPRPDGACRGRGGGVSRHLLASRSCFGQTPKP
jgi:hypothetical protein